MRASHADVNSAPPLQGSDAERSSAQAGKPARVKPTAVVKPKAKQRAAPPVKPAKMTVREMRAEIESLGEKPVGTTRAALEIELESHRDFAKSGEQCAPAAVVRVSKRQRKPKKL